MSQPTIFQSCLDRVISSLSKRHHNFLITKAKIMSKLPIFFLDEMCGWQISDFNDNFKTRNEISGSQVTNKACVKVSVFSDVGI